MCDATNPHTILTIDDEDVVRQTIVSYLTDKGYVALEAANGLTGLDVFRQHKPDAVLVDLCMPEMHGLEVLEILRRESPNTPSIVVSATGVLSEAVEALHRGAWDYVLKPIQEMAVLAHAIESVLERARLLRENRAHQEHLEEQVRIRTSELQTANTKLLKEIEERLAVEKELAAHRNNLEELVKQRTRELEEAQEQLLRRERLAALGQLIATVSHELRNPLGTIRTSIFSIDERVRGKGLGLERLLDRTERSVVRCDMIIDGLLDYARNRPLRRTRTDIDLWLKDILDEHLFPDGAILDCDLSCGAVLAIDPERLRRCVINLLTNACQAVEELQEDKKHISIKTVVVGDYVEIRVKDNGPGVTDEDAEKIFEPLYSTKGFGVGLGLTIVKQIVEQHGGSVKLDSSSGEETLVTMCIPFQHGARR